jgi:hypothetical protein
MVSTLKAVGSLFGPPPLLEGEDAAAYDELYGRICAAVKPVDVIYEMLVVDIAYSDSDISHWRRWKSIRIRECGLQALELFLREKLDYEHYRERFSDDLTEILQRSLPKRQEDYARMLARACAQNESAAVDEVNKIFDRICKSLDYVLNSAQAHEAQELTQKYRRRESATVKFIDELLAAAGKSIESLLVQALPKELDNIERIDRLMTLAENRRNGSLREIDRRRAVLGQKMRKSLQGLEDNEIEVIEAAPALQPKEKDQPDERPQDQGQPGECSG